MKRNICGGLKIALGAFLLVSGFALALFKLTGRHFPEPMEWIWGTISYSAFFGTGLDLALRERGITRLVFTGVLTDICVYHTAVEGFELNYDIVIAENAHR